MKFEADPLESASQGLLPGGKLLEDIGRLFNWRKKMQVCSSSTSTIYKKHILCMCVASKCAPSSKFHLLALYYLDPVTSSIRSVLKKTSAKGVFKGKLMLLTFKVVTQCDGISKNECQ